MSRTWAYLTNEESKQFSEKAANLNMTEGELTQKLIRLFLNSQHNSLEPHNCLTCIYYQEATSKLFTAFKGLTDFFTVVQTTQKNQPNVTKR